MAKFEENIDALASVVERLERGDLSLEDSVKLFEQGVVLSGACKAELDSAEGKIQILLDKRSGATTSMAIEGNSAFDGEPADGEKQS